MSTPAILLDNPRGENQSWEDWGMQLAEKYKTPASTPNLPLVPGQAFLPATWSEYGDQWKVYYDSLSETPIIPPAQSVDGIPPPTLPTLPPPGSSGDAWSAWGTSIGQAYAQYGKVVGEKHGLVPPQTPTDGNWTVYGNQWAEYGRKLAEIVKGPTDSV